MADGTVTFSKKVRRIAILFIGVAVIPGIVLSVLAVRTAGKENAYLEMQVRRSLESELDRVLTVTEEVVTGIGSELDTLFSDTLEGIVTIDSSRSSLVGVPYLLSPKRTIIRPKYGAGQSEDVLKFIKLNEAFFQDRRPVITYTRTPVHMVSKGKARYLKGGSLKEKKTVRLQYEELEQVRIDTTESVRFSQIIAGKESGIIPRLIDDEVMLLFWKKTNGNRIRGCVVNEPELRRRITERISGMYSQYGILTIHDHTGLALNDPEFEKVSRRPEPIVTRDLSGVLPRWKAAAYLSDPGMITSQSRSNALVVGLLIAILLAVMITGGVLIVRSVNAEMVLAQQQTTFVANVSHELKTPLTSIRLFAELMKEKRQPDIGKQEKYLGIIISETERLTRLINNVLDFSRAQSRTRKYRKENVDIVALCWDVIESQRVRLEFNHFTVQFDPKVDRVVVYADPEALKQALLNLLSNSEKYSDREKWTGVAVSLEGSSCRIDVIDRGIGIKPQHAAMIFRKFYRVDDSLAARVQGAGLGLTISKQIIDDHGGTIRYIENRPTGSIFRIILPVVAEPEHETENSGG